MEEARPAYVAVALRVIMWFVFAFCAPDDVTGSSAAPIRSGLEVRAGSVDMVRAAIRERP